MTLEENKSYKLEDIKAQSKQIIRRENSLFNHYQQSSKKQRRNSLKAEKPIDKENYNDNLFLKIKEKRNDVEVLDDEL